MKRILALLLVMLFSCAALAEAPRLGGWTIAEPVAQPIPEEAAEAFEVAVQSHLGMDYTPVALLATQAVAGTNFCLLCQASPVIPDPASFWCLVYVNVDPQGNAAVIDVEDLDLEIEADDDDDEEDDVEPLLGGWKAYENEPAQLSEDTAAALEKALEGLTGANYKPVAELGRQVVSGTNYCVFCAITPVVPNANTAYALVYLYQDLQGGVKIIEVDDVEIEIDED